MNIGNSWTNSGDWVVGWDWKDEEINWFVCRGNSEEIKEIKEKIQKYQSGKDYHYSPNEETEAWGKCEKFTIYKSKLKKELWEVYSEWFGDKCKVEHLEHLEPVDCDWLDKPTKPIKPIRPTRLIGKPRKNKEWKKYREEMSQYQKEMNKFYKEMENYYEKIREHNRKFEEKFSKVREKGEKISKTHQANFSENEHKWKWKEFWTGAILTLIISVTIFVLFKIFKKNK